MVKKIVLGILVAGLCGALVVGAVNRTISKTTGAEQAYRQGEGYDGTETMSDAGDRSRGKQESGGNNRWSTVQGSDTRSEADPSFAQEWVVLHGIVASVEEDAFVVELSDGETIDLEGSWSFAQEQGFAAQVGDQVDLVGYSVGDEFEIGRIENLTTGQTITLRDGKGRPQWAGR